MTRRGMENRRAWPVAGLLVCITVLSAVPTNAQQDLVRILSPATGTIVRPGQTITITVQAETSIEKVVVIGQHPLGVGQIVSAPAPGIVARGGGDLRPIRFQLTIPAQIRPGAYRVTAMGTVSGGNLESQAITLDVERSDEPSRIWTEPSIIRFEHLGDQIPIRVLGSFADKSEEELTKSNKTTFTSADPNIATVTTDGLVTAVAAGKTSIQIHTPQRDYSISVQVP
jgi:hypothetical protein